MALFRALGLGVAIVILKVLVPPIFAALESTTLVFLDTVTMMLRTVQSMW